ncbi:MAG: hypothetical protein PHW28_05600 [Mesotoga sp.]|nr:hypothetical protein [Mesotoga sp.]
MAGFARKEKKITEVADGGLGVGQIKGTGSPLAKETCYSFQSKDLFLVLRIR